MNIKVIANPKKPWAVELARGLATTLISGGHKIVKRGAEATICIGGDGTILYASHRGKIEGAILGIGGDKSYICQLRRTDLDKVNEALSRPRQKIMSLDCTVGAKRYVSLNDVVVHATHYRVAEMDVTIESGGQRQESQFEGDGMIVSTPLGSAAYAYSAGGEKLRPEERRMSLVPICPYKRAFTPRTMSEDSKIAIRAGSDCAFITDGIFVRNLKKGESVLVKRGPDITFFGGVGYEG